MPLIVDTYNVLHVVGVLPPEEAGIDLPGLIRLIQHSRYRNERVELICDGAPREDVPSGKHGPCIVRYSGPSRTADDAIAQLIRSSSIPKRLTIVSSDQEVARAGRRRRCRVLASDEFLRHLAKDVQIPTQPPVSPPPPDHVKQSQLDAWQRYFGVDEDSVKSLEAQADSEARAHRAKLRRGDVSKRTTQPTLGSGAGPSSSSSSDASRPLFPPELLAEAERLARQLDRIDQHSRKHQDDEESSQS